MSLKWIDIFENSEKKSCEYDKYQRSLQSIIHFREYNLLFSIRREQM